MLGAGATGAVVLDRNFGDRISQELHVFFDTTEAPRRIRLRPVSVLVSRCNLHITLLQILNQLQLRLRSHCLSLQMLRALTLTQATLLHALF